MTADNHSADYPKKVKPRTVLPVSKRASTVQDLFRYAQEHLRYEAQMFVYARGAEQGDQYSKNAQVELFALHLRNLIAFFYPKNLKEGDVTASNYLGGWDQTRPKMGKVLEVAGDRASKEVLHLTDKRIAGDATAKEWNFEDISAELRRIVHAFLDARPDHLPQETARELRKI